MALISIVAKNQTGSAIVLTQLYAPNGVIPASGQVDLTTYNRVEMILADTQLLGLIQGNTVLLNVNSADLTKEQSLAFLDAPTVPVKTSFGQASQGPSVNDDDTQGYSIGSVWITTAGVVYTCVDATTGSANWVTSTATPLSNEDPQPLGTAAPGTGGAASRYDHVHEHGDQEGGTLHADATFQSDGFMVGTDKHWANHAFDSGWGEGGALSYGTGFNVLVAAGEGFINDATDETTGPQLISWTATSVAATANVTGWVYVTSGGVVSYSSTEPDFRTNVILGTVHANASVLTFISHGRPARLQQSRGNFGEFVESVFGGVATTGLVTTEDAIPLHLDVAAGQFFISGAERDAPAAVNISWTYWFSNGAGGWVTAPGINVVDTTYYDGGAGSLVTIPTNRYKKDVLYITNNGDGFEYHMQYATETYVTLPQARAAPIPSPPSTLRSYAARFAGIVVQQGATSIEDIIDEKPQLGQTSSESSYPTRVVSTFIPIMSSSALSPSVYGRQIVVSVSQNGSGDMTFAVPPEATSVVSARILGIPSTAAAGPGKNIDLYTDYGSVGESPTAHQESDTTSTYDLTGTAGVITTVADVVSILSQATGGDIVGLEIDHNAIGGSIEYLGVFLTYEVPN